MHIVIWIVSGLAAGMLARIVTRGQSRGFVADVALGALGGITGTWLLRLVYGVGPPDGLAHIGTSVAGAVVLVGLGRVLRIVAGRAGNLAGDASVAALTDLDAHLRRLTHAERVALSHLFGRHRIAADPTQEFNARLTLGERVADKVATFGGSWPFLGCFAAFMLGWMFLNTQSARPSDPYPFILLNLILSCLAAVQAPVIMMSQNRQASRDRFEVQQDYQVNLRAEMRITELHAKLDEARQSDWQTLVQLQREQMTILERLEKRIGEAS